MARKIRKKLVRKQVKKKLCRFCVKKVEHIDYKSVALLLNFMTDRAKIVPRRISGNCAWHQRQLSDAVKIARELALVPYSVIL